MSRTRKILWVVTVLAMGLPGAAYIAPRAGIRSFLGGLGLFLAIYCCSRWAEAKGYGGTWILLGLAGPLGLLIVLLLPDLHAATASRTDSPPEHKISEPPNGH